MMVQCGVWLSVVTGSSLTMIVLFNCLTKPRVCWFCSSLLLMMSFGAVGMIKQFPERVNCFSLSFHGDVVFIGSYECVIQWNVITDTVARLEGYPSLIAPLTA